MSKYIDADLLIRKIRCQIRWENLNFAALGGGGQTFCINALEWVLKQIASLQQEQPIKVYRVENEKEQKGLWRKFDGTWEPLFDMLTDGQCKDMPMEDSPIYREGGKQWFASAPSKETLQKWFSKRDLEELTAKGFTISEFEVVGYKKISDFEYIFTRDNIISRTYLKVSDIYQQEQPCKDLEEAAEEYEQTRQDTDARSDNEIVRRDFIAGAKWQKEQMLKDAVTERDTIERAIAWLKEHANEYIVDLTPTYPDAPVNIIVGGMCWEHLRKAMEESE